jgi:hypothetical protein
MVTMRINTRKDIVTQSVKNDGQRLRAIRDTSTPGMSKVTRQSETAELNGHRVLQRSNRGNQGLPLTRQMHATCPPPPVPLGWSVAA